MGPLTLTRAAQTTSSAGRKQRATGERWVRVLSLIAFTISTWMLLTLAGGTRMFVQRVGEPSAALRAAEAELGDSLSKGYVFMAMFASLLLIPTLLELLTQATRANLAGREQHLATLRLLGASARDVRGMMLIDDPCGCPGSPSALRLRRRSRAQSRLHRSARTAIGLATPG